MPSKRKRSGPGFNRDDASAAKRSKPAYNQVYRLSSRNISGPGIFVTCVQGKERKAALQFIDLLNEVADRIYPGIAPQPLPEVAQVQSSYSTDDAERRGADDDDMDALRNGNSIDNTDTNTSVQVQELTNEAEVTKGEDKLDAGKEEDIAAQIAAELNEIKSSERQSLGYGRGKNKKAGTSAAPARFRNVETDTECFLFISVSPPFDPYLLVYTILSDVERTGEPHSRFVQRLTPVTTTCAANSQDLTTLAQLILPQYFSSNQEHAKTFKIDPRIRSHSKLKRADVIQTIAANIPTAIPEHEGGERTKIHTANLTNPDLWIVVEVVKNSAAISVLHDYERFKKLNLQSVAQASNERKAIQEHHEPGQGAHAPGRIAQSLQPKTPTSTSTKPETTQTANDQEENPESVLKTTEQSQVDLLPSKPPAAAQDHNDNEQHMSNFRLF